MKELAKRGGKGKEGKVGKRKREKGKEEEGKVGKRKRKKPVLHRGVSCRK